MNDLSFGIEFEIQIRFDCIRFCDSFRSVIAIRKKVESCFSDGETPAQHMKGCQELSIKKYEEIFSFSLRFIFG